MTRKERIKMAKKIADAELTIATSKNSVLVAKAKEEVLALSNKIESYEDMVEIDLLAQKFIEEEKLGK